MSSPCELITVFCPCGTVYLDSWRPSINLSIDDFDDDYIERVSSTTCPNCALNTRMGTLLARFENDHLRLDYELIPKPLPVILYVSRSATDQPETLARIKEWVTTAGQPGATQLEEILRSADFRNEYLYEELAYMLFRWSIENGGKEPRL
jgi:hypothetical protein